uniref:Uncharacterized protein n=1 Tax=Ditylenchus dipsaci TaxID=166011 RepID=A0A915DIL0_9BILA
MRRMGIDEVKRNRFALSPLELPPGIYSDAVDVSKTLTFHKFSNSRCHVICRSYIAKSTAKTKKYNSL